MRPKFTKPTRPAEPTRAQFDVRHPYGHYAIRDGEYAITPNPLLGPYADPPTPTEWEQLVTSCKALNYGWGKIARSWFQLGRYLHHRGKRTGQTWVVDKIYHTEGAKRPDGTAYGTGWLRARIVVQEPPKTIEAPLGPIGLTWSKPERQTIWWRYYSNNFRGNWAVR